MQNYEEILNSITKEQWGAIAVFASEMAGNAISMQPQPERSDDSEKLLTTKVTNFLHHVGVPASIKGYRYLRRAIILVYNNHEYVEAITKMLYPEVAKEFGTTCSRVERAIRHAIEVAWLRADIEELYKVFNWSNEKGKPTNSEFIAFTAEYMHYN